MKLLIGNSITEIITGGMDHIHAPNLLSELRDYMSVPVPGAFYSKAYKKHQWDGKKYFITPKGKFATGFLPLIFKYIDEEYPDLKVEIIDDRANPLRFRKDTITEVNGKSIEGKYEHQKHIVELFNHYIEFRNQPIFYPRGIADAATNAGKTTIFAALYLNIRDKNKRMLLVINRKKIFTQLVDYFTEMYGSVGVINDKQYDIQPVTIAMAQTLSNRIKEKDSVKEDVMRFNVLGVDESHYASSSTYKNILKYCAGAYMRFFLSGTALDKPEVIDNLINISSSGPKLGSISKVELMNKGISTPVHIRMYLCNTLLRAPIVGYDEYMDNCVFYSIERVSIMGHICDLTDGPTLIAVNEIHHGQFIMDNLSTKKVVEFTNSQDSRDVEKIKAFTDGEIDVLISTGIIREGINIPNITDIIYAAGGKSKTSIKQWMGRGERLHDGKEKVTFHDFYDVGKYIKAHSEKRMKVYEDERLPVLSNFNLKDARKLSTIIVK